MDIFYFNVNEEKNQESEELWTPYINIDNNLRITVAQRIYIYILFSNIAVGQLRYFQRYFISAMLSMNKLLSAI